MKKIMTVLLICVFLLCGCENFNYDLMVCNYHGMESLKYEIRYWKDEILSIASVEYLDLREFNDEFFESRMQYLKNDANVLGYYRGIETYIEEDDREITRRIVVDIEKYDCINDRFGIIQADLEEADLESVEALRNKLMNSGCECDVLVTTEAQKPTEDAY